MDLLKVLRLEHMIKGPSHSLTSLDVGVDGTGARGWNHRRCRVDVRITLKSGRRADIGPWPKSARTGREQLHSNECTEGRLLLDHFVGGCVEPDPRTAWSRSDGCVDIAGKAGRRRNGGRAVALSVACEPAAQLAPRAGRAESSPRWRLSLRPIWESRVGGCFAWPHSPPLHPPTETLARVHRDRLRSCHHSAYKPKADRS